MKKAEDGKLQETAASPQQVWETLTSTQQQAVARTVVRICQGLAAHWEKEPNHEQATQR